MVSLVSRKTLGLALFAIPMIGLLGYVALRTGPLAPVRVTVTEVVSQPVTPSLFGIGIVEARYTHKIGPTAAGRVTSVNVQPGEQVTAGQALAEMDPVDLDERIGAQDAAIKGAEAAILAIDAQIAELNARKDYAAGQSGRYEQLFETRVVSESQVDIKRQDLKIANAAIQAAEANRNSAAKNLDRIIAERGAVLQQRSNMRLVSPVDGLVTLRNADPGTTVVAGQSVIEIVDPRSIWINARFDQQRALGLTASLPASIMLRSQGAKALPGLVIRIEPHADPITQEILAKIGFATVPDQPPPLGELAEVTAELAKQEPRPVVPNGAIQRVNGKLGVWLVEDGKLRFAAIVTGASDLDGRIQVLDGLTPGQQVVVYSEKPLKASTRIKIVSSILGDPS